jgi:hypothetical protein
MKSKVAFYRVTRVEQVQVGGELFGSLLKRQEYLQR